MKLLAIGALALSLLLATSTLAQETRSFTALELVESNIAARPFTPFEE